MFYQPVHNIWETEKIKKPKQTQKKQNVLQNVQLVNKHSANLIVLI